ncbi:MAG: hypothetical protein V1896_02370 [Candidatus Zambryskibacteria bacterium]
MTLFIAVVIMGILLLISFAVVNITIKGTLFATSGRDSQYAFYAADAGLECALYWGSKYPIPLTSPTQYTDAFATSTIVVPSPRTINCAGTITTPNDMTTNGQIIGTSTLTRIGGGGDTNPTSTFGFVMDKGSNPVSHCAIVTVRKYYVGSRLMTYIKSRGYNTCGSSSRRVERGVEVTY